MHVRNLLAITTLYLGSRWLEMYSIRCRRRVHGVIAIGAAISLVLIHGTGVAGKDRNHAVIENLKELDELLPVLTESARGFILVDLAIQYTWVDDSRSAIDRANAINDTDLRLFALQQIVKQLLAQDRSDEAAGCAREHIASPPHLLDIVSRLAQANRADLAVELTRDRVADDRIRAVAMLNIAAREMKLGHNDSAGRIKAEIQKADLELASTHKFCASKVAVAAGILGEKEMMRKATQIYLGDQFLDAYRLSDVAGQLASDGNVIFAIEVARKINVMRRDAALLAIGRALSHVGDISGLEALRRDAVMTDSARDWICLEAVRAHLYSGNFVDALDEVHAIIDPQSAVEAGTIIAERLMLDYRYDEAAKMMLSSVERSQNIEDERRRIECCMRLAKMLAQTGHANRAAELVQSAQHFVAKHIEEIVGEMATEFIQLMIGAELIVGNRKAAVNLMLQVFAEMMRQVTDDTAPGLSSTAWSWQIVADLIAMGEVEKAEKCAVEASSVAIGVLPHFVEKMAARIDCPAQLSVIRVEHDPSKKAALLIGWGRGLLQRTGRPCRSTWDEFVMKKSAL